MMVKILNKLFTKVVYCENGRDAYSYLQNNDDIDLVVTDLMMPIMDGMELVRNIRAYSKDEAPIIVITAESDRYRDGLREMGISYLAKPLKLDQLAELIVKMFPLDKVHKKIVLMH